jgi:hypothetical protein
MKSEETVKEYLSISLSDLQRSDLGSKGFAEILPKLEAIKNWIDEMIEIAESNEDLPKELKNCIYNYINTYKAYSFNIKNYNLDTDAGNQFRHRANLISEIDAWLTAILFGFDKNNSNSNTANLLLVYNTLKGYKFANLEGSNKEIDEIKQNIREKQKQVDELLNLMQQKATSTTVVDYAAIFGAEATKYSSSKVKNGSILGSAERWLITSFITIILFILFIKNIGFFITVDFSKAISIVTIQLITRLIIISIFLYVMTFCFKQYSVHKHLHTLNTHRQNILNSFKLFIESIDKNDTVMRNALMMEVARAIYESGETGYITSKSNSDTGSSIMEVTKYLNKES